MPGEELRARPGVDPQEPEATVTLAEIARIAGVGRAAVSNWRRRQASFPEPAGGTASSPLFSLAEIQNWLSSSGRAGNAGMREMLWPQLEALGEREGAGVTIAAAGARLAGVPDSVEAGRALSVDQRSVVAKVEHLATHDGPRPTYEYLLRRWHLANARQVSVTPQPLARLMAEVAEAFGSPGGDVPTILDPACGTGGLLLAALDRWREGTHQTAGAIRVLGQELDPVLASLAAVRLAVAQATQEAQTPPTEVRLSDISAGDTLRADAHPATRADVILCSPPFNTRDWGHEELATDRRWAYGLPARSEPELAWVQHALARLAPGGVAVMLMPPAVASRRAGRRIRTAMLRTGVLRAVVTLPAGCAPPYSLALHLWVLRAPGDGAQATASSRILLVDAAGAETDPGQRSSTGGRDGVDWAGLRERVLRAVRGDGDGWTSVPVIDLLGDQVDLTPARHIPSAAEAGNPQTCRSWAGLAARLDDLRELALTLAKVESVPGSGAAVPLAMVGDLVRAGVLTLLTGRTPTEGKAHASEAHASRAHAGDAPPGATPVLTVQDVLLGRGPSGWLPAEEAVAAEQADELTLTAPGDVIVVAASRAFSAWVAAESAPAIGTQIYALRPDPSLIDPWFLAGCLRAPSNARRAGTHSSGAARVDVRRLQVLHLPLDEQRRYGEAARMLTEFAQLLRELGDLGAGLVNSLSESLLAGRLR